MLSCNVGLGGGLLFGVVGTPDEGAGFDVTKAQREALAFEEGKLLRQVEPDDRPMGFGRLEILPD